MIVGNADGGLSTLRMLGKHSTNEATVLTCLLLQTWEGEREGRRRKRDADQGTASPLCRSPLRVSHTQLVMKHFAPGTPAHQPPVRAGPSLRPFLLQVLYLVFKPSVLLLCLLHWATPGVFAGLSFPVYAMGVPDMPALGNCGESSPTSGTHLVPREPNATLLCGTASRLSGQSSSSKMTTHPLRGSQG